MFENDICVDLPNVLGVEPDGVNSPLPRFVTRARCPPVSAPSGVAAVGLLLRRDEPSNRIFRTLLFLPLFPFSLLLFPFDN